jgi:hypothetical protein
LRYNKAASRIVERRTNRGDLPKVESGGQFDAPKGNSMTILNPENLRQAKAKLECQQLFITDRCSNCGVPMSPYLHDCGNPSLSLCDCCQSILDSLQSPYWMTLHKQWTDENERRAELKRKIILGEERAQ